MESLRVVVFLVAFYSAVARPSYPFLPDLLVCPDRQSECPNNSTCCKKASSTSAHEYICCPLTNAVCCGNEYHCCPEGTTCSTAGTCTNQDGSAFPATETVIEVTTKKCPQDHKVVCPYSYDTCCTVKDGTLGCCHILNAVCCDDRVHCCPSGYVCNNDGTCKKKDGSTDALQASKIDTDVAGAPVPMKQLQTIGRSCPDSSHCADGFTCCPVDNGKYGCCPLDDAACCGDGKHCCPMGYTCDIPRGTCKRLNLASLLVADSVGKVKCDVDHSCADNNTCCKNSNGGFSCCPQKEGVCCKDHKHCCPRGYVCDLEDSTCKKMDSVVEIHALEKQPPVASIICPDQRTQCPDGATCCRLESGASGCCPMANAVCCKDGKHCCPNSHDCGSDGTCTIVIEASKNQPAVGSVLTMMEVVGNVKCDDDHSCPDSTTCCKKTKNEFGCCPRENAVCCSDHEHCCPHGYTCHTSDGTCRKGNLTVTALEKLPPVSNVLCPTGRQNCPSDNTCCKTSTGNYGCCPEPHAVCCEDGEHCCPKGYTCDGADGTCRRADPAIKKTEKQPFASVGNVICPDGEGECPNDNTCCKHQDKQYGCCPLPHAECCSDGKHCCPEGYKCDAAEGTCSKGSSLMKMLEKQPIAAVGSVTCPDGKSACPSGNTCCKDGKGQYGCCPLDKAVCCSDHKHCCPHEYTCDTGNGTCSRAIKAPGILLTNVGEVKCNSTVSCPGSSTCCKNAEGEYGCCPLKGAVCCSDHKHCCPHGYTCNTEGGTCKKGSLTVMALEKLPPVGNVVCADGRSSCPTDNTCCKTSSGEYGCCPMANAVCCKDGKHCCPNDYACNNDGTCTNGDSVIKAFEKQPPSSVGSVKCPDGESECPEGNTCCQLSSGRYGCCPHVHAVCCSDGKHCCPEGHTCDLKEGLCKKEGSPSVKFLAKTLAMVPTSARVNNRLL